MKKAISYASFEFGNLNRRICESNLKKKKKSIEEFGLLSRLTVTNRNGKLFLIDGQHRFIVLKELGIPITESMLDRKDYQGEEWLIKLMSEMNGQILKWKGMNYVETYASAGNKTYQNIMDFCTTFSDFAITAYIPLLTIGNAKGSKCTKHYLERGEFEVGSWKLTTDVTNALMDISEYTDQYKHFQFVKAFCRIYKHPDYQHQHFISQLKKGKHIRNEEDIFYGTANVEVFFSLIKDVYNKSLRNANRIE